jgi:hypothetical protein
LFLRDFSKISNKIFVQASQKWKMKEIKGLNYDEKIIRGDRKEKFKA